MVIPGEFIKLELCVRPEAVAQVARTYPDLPGLGDEPDEGAHQ